jgi:hypothetical protein
MGHKDFRMLDKSGYSKKNGMWVPEKAAIKRDFWIPEISTSGLSEIWKIDGGPGEYAIPAIRDTSIIVKSVSLSAGGGGGAGGRGRVQVECEYGPMYNMPGGGGGGSGAAYSREMFYVTEIPISVIVGDGGARSLQDSFQPGSSGTYSRIYFGTYAINLNPGQGGNFPVDRSGGVGGPGGTGSINGLQGGTAIDSPQCPYTAVGSVGLGAASVASDGSGAGGRGGYGAETSTYPDGNGVNGTAGRLQIIWWYVKKDDISQWANLIGLSAL